MLRNESPLSYDEIYIDILASGNWRFSQKLRQYWTMIPPEKKYECFLEFYVTSEGRFNRNLVRWAKKYRPTDYLIDSIVFKILVVITIKASLFFIDNGK